MIENLNKGNFWNEVEAKYPNAITHFRNWIDDYKKEVNWDTVFAPDVKFHDLPFEMQNGIIARYELEIHNNSRGDGKLLYLRIAIGYRQQIRNLFKEVDQNILQLNKKSVGDDNSKRIL